MTSKPLKPPTALDLSGGADTPHAVHLLGAGGAGVSGVGRILVHRGVKVTGHDRAESALLDALRGLGLRMTCGESGVALLPQDTQLVIRSVAVPEGDPQVLAAHARGIPVVRYSEALGALAPPARTLGVAGTHGKTTTSWMLWHALEGLGEELRGALPGALIGGMCQRLGTNALAGGRGGFFVVEACEYDRTFLRLAPRGAVITNVDADHLDYYGDLAAVEEAFARFADQVNDDGLLVVGREVPARVEAAAGAEVWRLGRELEVDLLGEERGCFRFRLRGPGWATPAVRLGAPGHFNVENAALALALAVGMSLREKDAADVGAERLALGAQHGVERFAGVGRRFEHWGEAAGVQVVHDYAHHPTEVRATLEAARRVFADRPLAVLFQPHQHSRTARFLEDFADALRSADLVVVSDVYGARLHIDSERIAGAPELVDCLTSMGVTAAAGGPLGSSVERFVSGLPQRAAALVLGAGDVELVRDELLHRLALRGDSAGRPVG